MPDDNKSKTIPMAAHQQEKEKWRNKNKDLETKVNDLTKQVQALQSKQSIGVADLFEQLKTANLTGEEIKVKDILIAADQKLKDATKKLQDDRTAFDLQKNEYDGKITDTLKKDRLLRIEVKAKRLGLDADALKSEIEEDADEAEEDSTILRLIEEGKAKPKSTEIQGGSQTFEGGTPPAPLAKQPSNMTDAEFEAHWEAEKTKALQKS